MHFPGSYVKLVTIFRRKEDYTIMNKTELISACAESTGLSKKDSERVLNAAIDAITAALVKGE